MKSIVSEMLAKSSAAQPRRVVGLSRFSLASRWQTALPAAFLWGLLSTIGCQLLSAQSRLQDELLAEEPTRLIEEARLRGDARRGAIVFYQPYLACSQCHAAASGAQTLGPDLSRPREKLSPQHLLEAVLEPSRKISPGYETIQVLTDEGQVLLGLLAEEDEQRIVLRDLGQAGRLIKVPKAEIVSRKIGEVSLMPAELVNQLAGRQQFLDLMSYLMEIAEGGPTRADELRPDPALVVAAPIPEYESTIDHAGMISDLDQVAYQRGQQVYEGLCINCHGDLKQPGSLPTSLRFGEGKFKNGSDPYSMYQTLTRGFGMMVPQAWMVPQQKYDVIHYIRQAYLEQHNPSQYFPVTSAYLAGLPKGDSRGPEPQNIQPWIVMDYGRSLIHTYEVGDDGSNFAYKGIATRVDPGPGGVSRGRHWMVFDHDTLRLAAAWSGEDFIDWNGIMFNGRHNIHPRLAGEVEFQNPSGPGWANPQTGDFEDPRLVGRDGHHYGPLPREWAQYRGLYRYGQQTIVSYTVGTTSVLESSGLLQSGQHAAFTRTFHIGPRDREMLLQVAHLKDATMQPLTGSQTQASVIGFGTESPSGPTSDQEQAQPLRFDGVTRIEVAESEAFAKRQTDFTLVARIKTTSGGTIFSKTAPQSKWVPHGKTWFVRDGRLCFDIGWVGVVQSSRTVNDGAWHDVAMTYTSATGSVQLYIDGVPAGQKRLQPSEDVAGHRVQIGYTTENFPSQSGFHGELERIRYYDRAWPAARIAELLQQTPLAGLQAEWDLRNHVGGVIPDRGSGAHPGQLLSCTSPQRTLLAGLVGRSGAEWQAADGNLRLRIPAGAQPLRFMLWQAAPQAAQAVGPDQAAAPEQAVQALLGMLPAESAVTDLTQLLQGGPTRWPETLTTQPQLGSEDGPFAVDVLTAPTANPWNCQMRLTGVDFYRDGRRAAVCTWDGDVWMVSGIDQPAEGLQWKRIAEGLFQPLGIRLIDDQVHLTCRDQLVILHDLNGDQETDYYECLNNDHQVTEHFHEFAMGLQTDAEGNFYYAKSARHALPALVPHHGTLLKISRDGSSTDIIATGFRAANGVCLNADGTFIVTDQEGHWNPKNRINWVTPGGFYGNMFGYHDVVDEADSAMQQPLCWITNAFDRSPAELLWVTSPAWEPLQGSLLNLSYGYGRVYIVPHEQLHGQYQGGMCAFPIADFPTGVMRGRFHPDDGQLYLCGMFAWAGNQQQPGGFYRLRMTGRPVQLPTGLQANERGMRLTFTEPLDPESAKDPANYAVKVWSLKRTKNYGSEHYDERPWQVAAASLSDDGRSVQLDLPEMAPTWCMEIRYSLTSAAGSEFSGVVHNTVHHLGTAPE